MISAATGFQTRRFSKSELVSNFILLLSGNEKEFEFIASSLRSASDLYKMGGHVTKIYRDMKFRLQYDNKRLIVDDNKVHDVSRILLDSRPYEQVKDCQNIRNISRLNKTTSYNRLSSTPSSKVYKSSVELAVRNYIRGLYADPPMYGLNNDFENYRELIDFIHCYDKNIKVSKDSISKLKNRKTIPKLVPRTPESSMFINYIKTRHCSFDEDLFFMESPCRG